MILYWPVAGKVAWASSPGTRRFEERMRETVRGTEAPPKFRTFSLQINSVPILRARAGSPGHFLSAHLRYTEGGA
jgi:hypothetical protein